MADLFKNARKNSLSESPRSMTGTVERVVFYSDETYYLVARFRREDKEDLLTIVGTMPGVEEGDFLQVSGEWVVHKRFGRQFKVETYQPVSPNTRDGVIGYLGSGIIEGIGKKLATRLVDKFGISTLQVIEEEPERLYEVSGLGKKRVKRLVKEVQAKRDERSQQIFLRGLGLTGVTLRNIYEAYGERAMEVIRENPYALIKDINYIGFKRADNIAEKLGIEKDSPLRGKAALTYILRRALDEGSTCLPEETLLERAHKLTTLPIDDLRLFLEEEIQERQLVRDYEEIYLRYIHEFEVEAAQLIRYQAQNPEPLASPGELDLGHRYTEEQKEAISTCVSEKILILTGGPGVGKTYTIMGIAQVLQDLGLDLALCAPTGRAAKRLSESTLLEAKTIHRMLRYQPGKGFQHDASNPLDVDAIIVDESSMIDILLFNRLLRAIPPSARLILVGDKDQLPPVGPGSPFCDLIASGIVTTVHLTKIFRQKEGSLIIQNAHKIQRGDMPYLNNTPPSDFYFIKQSDSERILKILEELIVHKIPLKYGIEPPDIQVLTPMRKGVLGYENLNQYLQGLFNHQGEKIGVVGPYTLREGDKIMQIRNNYDKEVFNGDIGYISKKTKKGVKVDFGDQVVLYDGKEINQLALAYAISVHKSQGSEYPCVIVPIVPQHTILLRRNLVYTAVTRGMNLVILLGEKRSMAMAVHRAPIEKRHGRFLDRLQE